MKKTTLLLLITLFPTLLFGQVIPTPEGYSITSSKPTTVVDGNKFYITEDENLYMLKIRGEKVVLQVFNIDQKLETSRKQLPGLRRYEDVIDIIKFQDNYYLFTSNFDKKKKTQALCYRKIDFKSQTIDAVKEIKSNKVEWRQPKYYSLYFSGDTSNMVVSNEIGENGLKYDYMVFDSNMELLWSKVYDLPFEGTLRLLDAQVDNLGQVYVAAQVYHAAIPSGINANLPKSHFELLQINESEINKIVLNKKIPNISDFNLVMSEDNSKYLVGFYNDNSAKYNDGSDGIFTMHISNDNKVVYENTYAFSIELINQYQTLSKQKKNISKKSKRKLDYKYLGLQDIIINKDGGLLLISEMRHADVSSGSSSSTKHYYEDIVVHKIGEDGALVWVKKLPKDQYGSKTVDFSYKYVNISGKHYFFFLDNIKNKTILENERPETHKAKLGGILSAFIIDNESGNVSKTQIINKREVVTEEISKPFGLGQFSFDRVIPIENGILIESYMGGKKDVIIKIEVLD